MSLGKVISPIPGFEVPVSLMTTSPDLRKASIVGQSQDCVRCLASASRGVRGGGSCGLAIECLAGEGREADRAARSGCMEVDG